MSERRIYWIVGGIVAVLLVVMLATWRYNRSSVEANRKAQQLIASYEAAGLRTPSNTRQVARVLGTDGGAVCKLAGSKLQQGYLKTRLGVGGEFYYRPVRVDREVLQGLALIVRVYCPDKLGDVRKLQHGLHFADVVSD